MRARSLASAVALLAFAQAGCQSPVENEELDATTPATAELGSPAGAGAMAPHLVRDGDDVLLSWLESEGEAHALLFSRLRSGAWTTAVVIAEGPDFFANWADVPKLGVAVNGDLYAHRLQKTAADTYAYSIFLSRSLDGGSSWSELGTLNDDSTPTEHGFVSYAARPEGGVQAVWLDGRAMLGGGPMALRTAAITDVVGDSAVLDGRVCECCPTTLASGDFGFVALYRDRTEAEVRDIGVARFSSSSGLRPAQLQPPGILELENWVIPGCPVNGPATEGSGSDLAVAWFTAADNRPRVEVAFSHDAGVSFGSGYRVDDGKPLGRVDLALLPGGDVAVSWLEVVEEGAQVRVRRISRDGALGPAIIVGGTTAERASGIPTLVSFEDGVLVAWVSFEDASRVRLTRARL